MLLENSGSGSMNGILLLLTLMFFFGLIITYVIITSLIGKSNKKKLITTYTILLREHIKGHTINEHPVAEEFILLENQDLVIS